MSSSDSVHQRRQSPLRAIAWLLLGGLLATVAVGVAMWLATGIGLWPLVTGIRDGRVVMRADQPTVVRQIQQLQRLETVRYTMDKIISAERDNQYLPKFLVSDRLLLVVHGEVIGGVDLNELQPNDVTVHGRKVSLHLPKAAVLVTRLDSARTRVYSRDTGLFSSPDPNLESEVREEAERQLQQAAQQDGILKTAQENAQNAITSILKGLGFEQVEFF